MGLDEGRRQKAFQPRRAGEACLGGSGAVPRAGEGALDVVTRGPGRGGEPLHTGPVVRPEGVELPQGGKGFLVHVQDGKRRR